MWPAIELSSMCKPLCKLCSSSRDDRDDSQFAYFGLIKVSEVGDFLGTRNLCMFFSSTHESRLSHLGFGHLTTLVIVPYALLPSSTRFVFSLSTIQK